MTARRIGLAAFWLLFALQWLWHGGLLGAPLQPWSLLIFAAPLLLPAVGLWRQRLNALFWAAVVSLLPFCHGISEAWVNRQVRELAIAEITLSLVLIVAVSLDGLQRRRRQRALSAERAS